MYDEYGYVAEDQFDVPQQSDCPTIDEWIDAAALEVARRIDSANEGTPPKSLVDWTLCCKRLGIEAVGLNKSASFTAVIMGEFAFDRWIIFYNSSLNAVKQSRYIAHEIAEYMTRAHSWSLTPPITAISGYAVRHMIARRVESFYFS